MTLIFVLVEPPSEKSPEPPSQKPSATLAKTSPIPSEKSFAVNLAEAALARTKLRVTYDPSYVSLAYPGGDVPPGRGVCSDVIVRCYRALGIDLQKRVHEDMEKHFSDYPAKWGLKRPDRNIDHRRVPNLQMFFERHGETLPASEDVNDYAVGDLVAWNLNGRGLTHIGIVVEPPEAPGERWVVHNIGKGPKAEDRLFDWEIIGHYRYAAERSS